jgi:hypothetical protein
MYDDPTQPRVSRRRKENQRRNGNENEEKRAQRLFSAKAFFPFVLCFVVRPTTRNRKKWRMVRSYSVFYLLFTHEADVVQCRLRLRTCAALFSFFFFFAARFSRPSSTFHWRGLPNACQEVLSRDRGKGEKKKKKNKEANLGWLTKEPLLGVALCLRSQTKGLLFGFP